MTLDALVRLVTRLTGLQGPTSLKAVVFSVGDLAELALPPRRVEACRPARVASLPREHSLGHRHLLVTAGAPVLRVVAGLALDVAPQSLEPVGHVPVPRVDPLVFLDTVVAIEALALLVAGAALVLVRAGRELMPM